MRIVFLVPFFPPYISGLSVRAYRLAWSLNKRGHEITIHTAFHPKAQRVEKIDGIKVKRHDNIARFLNRQWPIMPGLFKMFGEEEMLKADVIQAFGLMAFPNPTSLSFIAASLKYVRKKVFVLQPVFIPLYYYVRLRMRVYRLTFGRTILRCADRIIAQTSFERDGLLQLGVHPDKIQVIPNAIDSESYKQLPDPTIFRNKYGIDAHEKIILFVGAPTVWKGLDHLVLAMENVLKKVKEAKLVVVGPLLHRTNKLLSHVSSNVRDNIVITGLLTGKSLISAYSAADIFVLPSKVEVFGNVFLEAAAAGLPIVCTRTGVAPDLVINGKNGFFVGYGRVGQISNAITKVLMDSGFKREAERSRNGILEAFGSQRVMDQWEKAYLQPTSRSSIS